MVVVEDFVFIGSQILLKIDIFIALILGFYDATFASFCQISLL